MKIQLYTPKPDPIVFTRKTSNIKPKIKVDKPTKKGGLDFKA